MNHILKALTALTLGALAASPLSWADDLEQGPTPTPVAITDDGENLRSIEADSSQIISEITAIYGGQMVDGGTQLSIALDGANAEQLLAARNATSVEELDSILLAAPAVVGDLDQDYSFTPVTPCRIVDTRLVGGNFTPGEAREYYVYGLTDVSNQGGNPAGCPDPAGEPLGVALNVTAVGVSGNGNFVVYPANVTPPSASLVNYRTGVQNVANAASIKTYASIGPREIEVLNSFGSADLVIDVLGYYYAPVVPVGVDYAGGDQTFALTGADVTVRSISVTTPVAGYCTIHASGYFQFGALNAYNSGRCSITTGTAMDFTALIIHSSRTTVDTEYGSFAATRGYTKPAGSTTYNLVCNQFAGTVSIGDSQLTAVCTSERY